MLTSTIQNTTSSLQDNIPEYLQSSFRIWLSNARHGPLTNRYQSTHLHCEIGFTAAGLERENWKNHGSLFTICCRNPFQFAIAFTFLQYPPPCQLVEHRIGKSGTRQSSCTNRIYHIVVMIHHTRIGWLSIVYLRNKGKFLSAEFSSSARTEYHVTSSSDIGKRFGSTGWSAEAMLTDTVLDT